MNAVLLAVLLCLGTAARVAPGDAPRLALGETVAGEIRDDDAVVRTEILLALYRDAEVVGQTFRIEVTDAGPYCIDVWGYGFDAYLVLRDESGKVLAEDDDGMAGTDARLVVELAPRMGYRLEVCALHDQRGAFEVELYAGQPDASHSLTWSDQAVEARVRSVFEPEAVKKVSVVKSKHYLVLTDSGAGAKFGKILDNDIYKGFFKYYGLEAPKAHRPLFVYLFNNRDDYIAFLGRELGWPPEQAAQTGGIAYRDFYATSYSSPRDPTHFHECAHQIMSNLLGLSGGGSWFQEGVAECYEDEIGHLNRKAETRVLITTKAAVPLRELFAAESMLFSAGENTRGSGGARGMYGEAASVILLMKQGAHKKQFEDFLLAMGKAPRSDLDQIEAVLRDVCGVGIDELDAEWRAHYE